MRNLFEGWHWIVLVVVILLVFGARRLPDIAKSVGQSMKIFKRELKDLRSDDEAPTAAAATTSPGAPTGPTSADATAEPAPAPAEPPAPEPTDRSSESGPSTPA